MRVQQKTKAGVFSDDYKGFGDPIWNKLDIYTAVIINPSKKFWPPQRSTNIFKKSLANKRHCSQNSIAETNDTSEKYKYFQTIPCEQTALQSKFNFGNKWYLPWHDTITPHLAVALRITWGSNRKAAEFPVFTVNKQCCVRWSYRCAITLALLDQQYNQIPHSCSYNPSS